MCLKAETGLNGPGRGLGQGYKVPGSSEMHLPQQIEPGLEAERAEPHRKLGQLEQALGKHKPWRMCWACVPRTAGHLEDPQEGFGPGHLGATGGPDGGRGIE